MASAIRFPIGWHFPFRETSLPQPVETVAPEIENRKSKICPPGNKKLASLDAPGGAC
jgi:hypothetical protein